MSEIVNTFSVHLARKERRERRSYSSRQIAEATGVPRSTIDSYLKNTAVQYDMRKVQRICEWLEITVSEFFTHEEVDDSKELNALLPATA